MQAAQTQMQGLTEAINRDRGEVLLVQRELSDLTGVGVGSGGTEVIDVPPIATAYDEALAKARASLEALEQRLTADHPDVVRQRRVVADLEERVQNAQLQRPLRRRAGAVTGATVADRTRATQPHHRIATA